MRSKSEIKLRVSDIARKLESGFTTARVIKEYTATLGVTRRTVERYIALAKDIIDRNLGKRDMVIEANRADIIGEEASRWLKSNLEIEAKLCAIISGKVEVMRPVQTKTEIKMVSCRPNFREMLLAMGLLLRMRGVFKSGKLNDEAVEQVVQLFMDSVEKMDAVETIRKNAKNKEN